MIVTPSEVTLAGEYLSLHVREVGRPDILHACAHFSFCEPHTLTSSWQQLFGKMAASGRHGKAQCVASPHWHANTN